MDAISDGIQLLIAVAVVCSFGSLLGLVSLWRERDGFQNDITFIEKYGDNFNYLVEAYAARVPLDPELCTWLVKYVNKMQRLLGSDGILQYYRSPYADYAYTHYQLLVNTLPQIIRGEVHGHDVNSCLEAVVKRSGELEEQMEANHAKLRNPLAWLQVGLQLITLLPIYLLGWLGLLEFSVVRGIAASGLFRFVSGSFSLFAILRTIVGLIVDWGELQRPIRSWF
jgi:hypothetical protein